MHLPLRKLVYCCLSSVFNNGYISKRESSVMLLRIYTCGDKDLGLNSTCPFFARLRSICDRISAKSLLLKKQQDPPLAINGYKITRNH